MIKSNKIKLFILILIFIISPVLSCSINQTNISQNKATPLKLELSEKQIVKKVNALQIPFIENSGQVDKSVKYYANTFAGNVFVTEDGEIVYGLIKKEKNDSENIQTISFREKLLNSQDLTPRGKDSAVTKVSYFTGNDKTKWKRGLSTFNEVALGEVYKGIDLSLKAHGNNVEKIFTVAPGSNAGSIKLGIDGVNSLQLNENGELEIETSSGKASFSKPYAYQEIGGKQIEVQTNYVIADNQNSYGFQVASYDKSYPLVIDPLLASTFLGGSSEEDGGVWSIDSSGNLFITGHTYSSGFPTTFGAYNTSHNSPGNRDVFVSKLSNDLTRLY